MSFSVGPMFTCVSHTLYSQVASVPVSELTMPNVQARMEMEGWIILNGELQLQYLWWYD